MNVFFNPTDNRLYITKETPTIDPLPVELPVTVNASGQMGVIAHYNKSDKTYILDGAGSTNHYDASDFRFNPALVNIIYDAEKNSISFSNKKETIGGKKFRKTRRKINKKRKSNKRR
jgi:hypothetical protein